MPTVVQFVNGSSVITPAATDYEPADQALVLQTAESLSSLGGLFHTSLLGNTGFAKIDAALSQSHQLALGMNISRYYGSNNVFFDSASPITPYAMSENGEEDVSTVSANAALTSAFGVDWTNRLRFQFSRDQQGSLANSQAPLTKITGVVSGFGESSILPRHTHERRFQLAETIARHGRMHQVKFGGDVIFTRIINFFPKQFAGEYQFDTVRVNPFTYAPQSAGLALSPLRAFAHDVPRYYTQDFGSAYSHPDTDEYSFFLQDTIAVVPRLNLSAGVRYDRQTFSTSHLTPNPIYPQAGRVPDNGANFAPRFGFSAALGHERTPTMLRGGFGIFFARVPQIYNSEVELNNGLTRAHLKLDNRNALERPLFPVYPNPLITCTTSAEDCKLPPGISGFLTRDISSFAADFQTPYVMQGNLSVEQELPKRTSISADYLYVAGKHLIRARDVNLPAPVTETYPVYDAAGNVVAGSYYSVQSFSTWQLTKSITCAFPPCINDPLRPIASTGAINSFESSASSIYHGLTVSLKHTITDGLYLRLAYTYAKAIDNGQDALVVGSPAQVQNASNPNAERALSVTDQRHRIVGAFSADPNPIHRQGFLKAILNEWRFSGIFTAGSGRPITGKIGGDPNADGNSENDRLPGYSRNSFTGPDYLTQDVRLTRKFEINERWKIEAMAECFNLSNRNNKRVDITDNGFENYLGNFIQFSQTLNGKRYPAYFQRNLLAPKPNNAFAPREIQLGIKLRF